MTKKIETTVEQKLLEPPFEHDGVLVPPGWAFAKSLGDNMVKITDAITGRVVCFIGKQKGVIEDSEELIHFPCPIPVALVDVIGGILEKKIMRKALKQGDYEKAQRFADKKFADFYSKK